MSRDNAKSPERLKVLAIASPGGHVLEMNELLRDFSARNVDLLTYEEAFDNAARDFRSIRRLQNDLIHRGRSRAFAIAKHMAKLTRSSWKILDEMDPDLIISTGSEIAIPAYLWAKRKRRRALYVESVCRLTSLSITGAVARSTGAEVWVQWPELAAKYPDTLHVGNVLPRRASVAPPSSDLIFIMSGTAAFPRLVDIADEIAAAGRRVVMQRGRAERRPSIADSFDFVKDISEIETLCQRASVVVSHAGAGSIMTALRQNSRLVVVPRRESLKEHTNDHQFELSAAMERNGLARVANTSIEVNQAIDDLLSRGPTAIDESKSANPAARLRAWIER